MLAVIDYGGGNLGSLLAALHRSGAEFSITGDAGELAQADSAVLPGDGAFRATMDALRARGLDEAIRAHVAAGKPFLGICVGMQILYEGSSEFGSSEGLGILRGEVARFVDAPRVPHMGWNRLDVLSAHPFVRDLGDEPFAYFLHSYRAPVSEDTVAAATHGERFTAIAARGNVMGTQFHPEKSRQTGAQLLQNFLSLSGERRA